MKVKEFGEASVDDAWYLSESGERVKCEEVITEHLWNQWVQNLTAHKGKDGKYVIYKVTDPEMNLQQTVP